jgi:teichuronic acid exporter
MSDSTASEQSHTQTNTALSALPRTLVSAIAWTALAKWLAQIVSWASMFVVVRLLSPTDFGLIGMATVYLGFMVLVSEFGIGSAIVTLRDLAGHEIAQLHTLSVAVGVAACAVSAALAFPIAGFFRQPEVAFVILANSTTFAIGGFRSVPAALLQKDLQYRTLSAIEAVQALVQACATMLFAYLGAGYWSFVFSGILGVTVGTVIPAVLRPTRLAVLRLSGMREAVLFSWRLLVGRMAWYIYSNADFMVAGRVLGTAPVGVYTMAWNIANMPGEKIVAMILRVTPGFFSAVQHDVAELRRYLTWLTEGLAVLLFPIVVGFAITAPDLIPLALGDKWAGAIVPAQLLAGYCFIRSVLTLLPQIVNVVGQTRFGMWLAIATLVILVPSFVIASRWGLVGIAAVWITVYPLTWIPMIHRTLRSIGMPFAEYARSLWPAVTCSAIMAVCVVLAGKSLEGSPSWLRLALQVSAGAVAYGAAFLLFFPTRVAKFRGMYKRLSAR